MPTAFTKRARGVGVALCLALPACPPFAAETPGTAEGTVSGGDTGVDAPASTSAADGGSSLGDSTGEAPTSTSTDASGEDQDVSEGSDGGCDERVPGDCDPECPGCPPLSSVCLDRPADQITAFDAGVYDEEFDEDFPADEHTFDMRGVVYEMDFIDDVRAVTTGERLAGACIVGVRVQGTQAPDTPWADVKNTDGVRFTWGDSASVGHVTAEGVWVDNVGDGFEPPRYSGSAGLPYTWSLRSSYFRRIRDDVVENDACHAGTVEDVLVDASFVFISSRPGSGNDLQTGDVAPVITIDRSLIHVGTEELGGRLWKWPGGSSSCTPEPVLEVRDSVFRIDQGQDANLTFPEGTYDNVTLVWLGGGAYPEPVPAGVTVTDDVAVWDAARAAWLDAHGCDANGDSCTALVPPR